MPIYIDDAISNLSISDGFHLNLDLRHFKHNKKCQKVNEKKSFLTKEKLNIFDFNQMAR